MKHVILLHGFPSSGKSGKATFLHEKIQSMPDVHFHPFDFNPTPKDFEYMTVSGMINRLRQYTIDQEIEACTLIGSSMGALVALNYAHRFGADRLGGVKQLLLLAPLLSFFSGSRDDESPVPTDPDLIEMVQHYGFDQLLPLRVAFDIDGLLYINHVPPSVPVTIIHGRFDKVIPIHHSQTYAAQYPNQVQFIETDSDHRLSNRLDLMWQTLTQICNYLASEVTVT